MKGRVLVAGLVGLFVLGARAADPPEPPATPPTTAESPRAEFERIADALYAGTNRYLGRGYRTELIERIASGELDRQQEFDERGRLVQVLLNFGELDEALRQADSLLAMLDPAARDPGLAALYRLRALVHLRRAEVQNCVRHHGAESCIFPLREGGLHLAREPALQARRDYLRALEIDPDDLGTRWLLNIVYMALGEYPDGVPEKLLLPPSAFESKQDVGRFPDVAQRLGLDDFDLCGGVVVEDFDGDGRLDVLTSSYEPRTPLKLSRNRGKNGFEDVSHATRVDEQLGGLNVVAADYDNDGRRDVLVLRGAWLLDDGRIRNSLLRNDPGGTFVDVTRRAGLADPAFPTQAAAWGDFDGDGDLDLYVCNESRLPWPGKGGDFPSQLFRNDGDGTFTDVAAAAGVTNDRYCKGVSAGDYDNDGRLDLYVSNAGPNRLYHNRGEMRFVDVAAAAGVTEPSGRSFATWFFDQDNDGWLDLFVTAYRASIADLAAVALGRPHGAERARLYRNNRDGTFRDVAPQLGLDGPYLPMGANFGDLDNDGYLDIYLGTGEPDYQALMPNVMLRNDGGHAFVDVTESGGFGHLQKGHGVAFADIDDDGDQDIYHQIGGFYPGDRFHNALFLNPGHDGHLLVVRLVGRTTNRDAIGARIRLVVEDAGRKREIHRAVGSVSSFGGSPIRQEIGIGRAERVHRLEVFWPVSGLRSVFQNVPIDRTLRITEGEESLELVPRAPQDAGAGPGTPGKTGRRPASATD